MSTRSRIAIKLEDGTIKSIYCHFDGYKSGVGKTLAEHYTDPKKIEELIDLGDLSVLGTWYDEELSKAMWGRYDLSEEERNELYEKTEDMTITYKSRGETNIEPRIDKDYDEFMDKLGECWEEYTYLFMEDYSGVYRWHCAKTSYMHPLDFEEENE